MRKFKIKNRRKRKYVKKNELAASYASVQSLTVGFVPFVLVAIALFATILMYNPPTVNISAPSIPLAVPAMPQIALPKVTVLKITIPEVNLPKMSLPSIPEVTLPEVSLPKMPQFSAPEISFPKITIPNPMPAIAAAFNSFIQVVRGGIQIFLEVAYTFWINLSTTVAQIGSAISSATIFVLRQISAAIITGFTISGQFIVNSARFIATVAVSTARIIASVLQYAFTVTITTVSKVAVFLTELTIKVVTTLIAWIQAAITAIVSAWNSFIWFLGTPFRSLHAYSIEVGRELAPYIAFISKSLEQASAGLSKGGETIVNGTIYVSSTVEHNQEEK